MSFGLDLKGDHSSTGGLEINDNGDMVFGSIKEGSKMTKLTAFAAMIASMTTLVFIFKRSR